MCEYMCLIQTLLKLSIIMQSDQLAPKPDIDHILKTLKLKSIDDLFTLDNLNIQSIAKSTNNHKIIVQELLQHIQTIITKPYTVLQPIKIQLSPIVNRWKASDNGVTQNQAESTINWSINTSDIVEIIGRTNGGKSFFMNEIIIECLKQNRKILYLDNNQNIHKLSYRINEERQKGQFDFQHIYLKCFQFKTLSQLGMLLHCIGNCLNEKDTEPFFLFIDSIGNSQEPQIQNHQSVSSLQNKLIDKFKKLVIEVSQKIGTVIYASRCNNYNSLFNNVYKQDKHRPKWIGSASKQWDSIAEKTICIDYSRTKDNRQYWRMLSTKAIDCKVYQFTRKI